MVKSFFPRVSFVIVGLKQVQYRQFLMINNSFLHNLIVLPFTNSQNQNYLSFVEQLYCKIIRSEVGFLAALYSYLRVGLSCSETGAFVFTTVAIRLNWIASDPLSSSMTAIGDQKQLKSGCSLFSSHVAKSWIIFLATAVLACNTLIIADDL